MLTLIRTAYFQDFVESLGSGVVILNSDGQVYVANDNAARIMGRDKKELLGRDWPQVFAGLDRPEAIAKFLEQARAHRRDIVPEQARMTRSDGTLRYLDISASPLIDFHKVFGILVQLTDVTHLVELHEREKAILEERGRLERERSEGLQHLSEAVAHQIRNPTMAIGGFANLLLRSRRPAYDSFAGYLGCRATTGGNRRRRERLHRAAGVRNPANAHPPCRGPLLEMPGCRVRGGAEAGACGRHA